MYYVTLTRFTYYKLLCVLLIDSAVPYDESWDASSCLLGLPDSSVTQFRQNVGPRHGVHERRVG